MVCNDRPGGSAVLHLRTKVNGDKPPVVLRISLYGIPTTDFEITEGDIKLKEE